MGGPRLPRPMCGETNSLPSDPGTLKVGCSPLAKLIGESACVSEMISRKTQETKNLVKAAKGAKSPIKNSKILQAAADALHLSREAGLLGFDDRSTNGLLEEMGAAVSILSSARSIN